MMARRDAKRLRKCVLSAFNDYFILTGEFISSLHYRREFGVRRRRRSLEKLKVANKNVVGNKKSKKSMAGKRDRKMTVERFVKKLGKNLYEEPATTCKFSRIFCFFAIIFILSIKIICRKDLQF
jgi:hypothetical protein